jgi:hypothetical protein
LICIVAVFLLPASASARVVPIWSYEALLKEADVVAIVKVTIIEDKARLEREGDPSWYQGKVAHATVGLMLKGDARKTLSFQFYDDNHDPEGADLSKAGKVHYLVFLKKTADGALAPATGHGNARASIYEVAPQSVNEIDVAPAKESVTSPP